MVEDAALVAVENILRGIRAEAGRQGRGVDAEREKKKTTMILA